MIKRNNTGFPIYDLEPEDVTEFWDSIEHYVFQSALEDINDNDAPFHADFAEQYYKSVIADYDRVVQDDTGGTYYFDYNLLSKEQDSKLIANVQKELVRVLKK